jgi:DNA-directed RNA polymerase specialized sigma24 family protein
MVCKLRRNLTERMRLPKNDSVLLGRAELLSPLDRDLVKSVFIHNQPPSVAARMLNLDVRLIRSRLYRLGERLTDPTFIQVARAMRYLNEEEKNLARLHFCQRFSQRELSRLLGMKHHDVRRQLDKLAEKIGVIRKVQESVVERSRRTLAEAVR